MILRRFLKKMKTCYYKVTVQILYRKPGEEKLDDKRFWKIISSDLHMEMPQSFTLWMLIMSWLWALLGSRFFIILYIFSFEKIMVSKMLFVCLEHVLGKVLIFLKSKNWKVDISLQNLWHICYYRKLEERKVLFPI